MISEPLVAGMTAKFGAKIKGGKFENKGKYQVLLGAKGVAGNATAEMFMCIIEAEGPLS